MGSWGKVIGGDFINATVSTNRKGELALSPLGFKRTPNLTPEAISSWEEVFPERKGGALNAISKVGQAVSLAALRGPAGKAASAAVGSTAELVAGSNHTIRVDWVDGKRSLIELPEKQFQHFSILLKDLQVQSVASELVSEAEEQETPGVIAQLTRLAGVVRPNQPDTAEQIARLAQLRDQGVLTDAEFAAKKAELLGLISQPLGPAISSDSLQPKTAQAPPPLPTVARLESQMSSPTPPPIPKLVASPPPPSAPASWAPDPLGRFELRYWDGHVWTQHVTTAGCQHLDPI
jgi:hypothetical protein